jgi:hypothetical protein
MTRTYVRRDNTGAIVLGAIVLIVLIAAAWWVLTYGGPSTKTPATQPGVQPPGPAATVGY